jgi:hypothetical protein
MQSGHLLFRYKIVVGSIYTGRSYEYLGSISILFATISEIMI